MNREEWKKAVKAARILRGETVPEVARAIFYSTSYVQNVIGGTMKSKRVENAISAYLGIDPPTETELN